MKVDLFPNTQYLRELSALAGAIILKGFGSKDFSLKEDRTPVMEIDKKVNSLVIDRITNDFPKIGIFSEEGSHMVRDSVYSIVCDPNDGTIPYLWGLPISTFSIALLKSNVPIKAIINDPFWNRSWEGSSEKRTYLNDIPVNVSDHDGIKDARLGVFSWIGTPYNSRKIIPKIEKTGARWINPAAICILAGLVAEGKMDGLIFPTKKSYEASVIKLLIEGAGGKVTNIFGKPLVFKDGIEIEGMIASNGHIHDELVEIVASCQ